MKRILIGIVLLFMGVALQAQISDKDLKKHNERVAKSREKGTLIESLDTVFKAGVAVFIFEPESKGWLNTLFTLKDLNGKHHAYISLQQVKNVTPAQSYWEVRFIASEKVAELQGSQSYVVEQIYKSGLFTEQGSYDSEAENRFVIKYGRSFSNIANTVTVVKVDKLPVHNLVERNRQSSVMVMGDEIKQDFKTVGKVVSSTVAAEGKIKTVYKFYLPDGTLVAEATNEGVNSLNWSIVTSKDNEIHTTTTEFAKDKEQLATWLIARMYL